MYLTNRQAILYVRLSKDLYEMLRLALLFSKRLRIDLKNTEVEVNPNDPCVAIKMVNGHQMTVCWHMDNLNVSHKEESAVTALAMKLSELYYYGLKMTICCDKLHKCLGVNMDYVTDPGIMIASMIKYLYKVIAEFPEVIKGT